MKLEMPILKLYTSPGQLTDEEKQELATILTSGYTKLMPAFFVNIMFHEVSFKNKLFPPSDFCTLKPVS